MIYHPELSVLDGEIGQGCTIHAPVWIGKGATIGDGCKIQAFAYIPPGVHIGNDVFIGPGVTFTNDRYPPSSVDRWEETHVLDGAVIGANATILAGISIGRAAFIAAGAVVTKSVDDYDKVMGVPARVYGSHIAKMFVR